MASPQVENGYTKIANELIEALARTRFSGSQGSCVWFLLRKTYGYDKKEDAIALSQWSAGTGLQRSHVCRALGELRERNIVTKNGNKWGLQKDYTRWHELPKLVKGGKITKIGRSVTNSGNDRYQKWHIQNKIDKRNFTKERGVTKNGNIKDWRNAPHPMSNLPWCSRCHTTTARPGSTLCVNCEAVSDTDG